VDFLSFYIEIPVMIIMYIAWLLAKRTFVPITEPVTPAATPGNPPSEPADESTPLISTNIRDRGTNYKSAFDIVDIHAVDLYKDEYVEDVTDDADDEEREKRSQSRLGLLWKLYYLVA
jgi:AAT family amino acid transporter